MQGKCLCTQSQLQMKTIDSLLPLLKFHLLQVLLIFTSHRGCSEIPSTLHIATRMCPAAQVDEV